MSWLIPFTLLVITGGEGPTPASNSNGLEDYVGKDLRRLDKRAAVEFLERLKEVTGDEPGKRGWGCIEPWWVKPFASGNATWVFLEAYPGYDIPDVSHVRIHAFDKKWKRLTKQSFPTGYRLYLNEVTIVKDGPIGQDVLVAKENLTGPFVAVGNSKPPDFERRNYLCQFFALLDDHFVLVRLDNNGDELVRNHYHGRAPFIGPAVPKRTREEWIRSLDSENPVEQLATLVWLSGIHLRSTDPRREDTNQESIEDSKLFESVRDAREMKKKLEELQTSPNAWVREYAKLSIYKSEE